MEKDKLKSFIDSNRESFDDLTPGPELWSKIDEKLDFDPKEKRPYFRITWMVAAATFFVLLGAGLQYLVMHEKPAKNEIVQAVAIEDFKLASVSEELAEVEHYYITQIDFKKDEIQKLEGGNLLLNDLKDLQEDYNALSEELQTQANSEVIIEAMIENYRLRLALLERMLNELKHESESKEDEYINL